MELKESNDHRCYMTEYGIPTVQIGNGDVIVCDLKFNDGFAGIGFSLGEKGDVGRYLVVEDGANACDYGVFFQIIATNPESIQVLIDRLTAAKDSFKP